MFDRVEKSNLIIPVASEHVDLLKESAKSSGLAQLLLLTIAGSISKDFSKVAIIFMTLIFATNVLRIGFSRKKSLHHLSPEKWLLGFRLVTSASALGWGLFCASSIVVSGLISGTSIIRLDIAAGLAAASISTLASDRQLARLFAAGILLPIVVALLIWPTRDSVAVAGVTTIYLFYLFNRLEIQFKTIWQLRANIAKERLILADRANLLNSVANAKSTFFANVSHEIRTPLNGIIGIAELLEHEPLEPNLAAKIQILTNSSQYLLELINNFLDFSKIGAGQVKLNYEPTDIRLFIKTNLHHNEIKAFKKNLELKFVCEENIDLLLSIDSLRINQILFNLVSNAIKFAGHGVISVSAAKESHCERDYLSVSVRDQGVGIPDQYLKNIFEPYAQGAESTQKNFGGTGLGLALCRQLLTLMDGDITVISEVGVGSTFTFRVPYAAVTGAPESSTNIIHSTFKLENSLLGFKILVAEDNLTNRSVISAMLLKAGAEFTVAENGKIAFEYFKRDDFDIVLMDCMMPICDGYNSTRLIRSHEFAHKRLPTAIIALTASVDEDIKKQCFDCGMDTVLTKPLRFNKLVGVIQSYAKASQKAI